MDGITQLILHTLGWAALATVFVMFIAVPIAYLLARYEFWGKRVLSTVFVLPMVLPPTAVGYLLLYLMADGGVLGKQFLGVDLGVVLTWKGVVLAYAVMSFPLVVRASRISFEEINPRLEYMARSLGHGTLRVFLGTTLPLASRGLLAALVLGFTRAMGEFGATVMVAGNIPGRTQTLASAIYSAQQAGNEQRANILLVLALVIGFVAVFATEWLVEYRGRSRNVQRGVG